MKVSREQILDVARRHIARYGYSKISLTAIAADLGVVKGALYYHVPGGKREILDAVLEREETRLLDSMRDASKAAKDDPVAALREAIRARIGFMRDLVHSLDIPETVLREIQSVAFRNERGFYRRERELYQDLLTRGEEAGVFETAGRTDETASLIQATVRDVLAREIYDEPDDKRLETLFGFLDGALGAGSR
jgi:AcrR family transcriptional regulator